MLRERLRVVFRAELVEQLGRALDVREEEGDRAGREVAPHSIIAFSFAIAAAAVACGVAYAARGIAGA